MIHNLSPNSQNHLPNLLGQFVHTLLLLESISFIHKEPRGATHFDQYQPSFCVTENGVRYQWLGMLHGTIFLIKYQQCSYSGVIIIIIFNLVVYNSILNLNSHNALHHPPIGHQCTFSFPQKSEGKRGVNRNCNHLS